MKPAEDKEYVAYCQKALDKAKDEYDTATKSSNLLLKVAKGLGTIVGISIVLLLLTLFINYLEIKIVISVLMGSFLVFVIVCVSFFEQKAIKKRYEGRTTCPEKISTYARSYKEWSTIKAEKKAREKIIEEKIEESEQICAALQTRSAS